MLTHAASGSLHFPHPAGLEENLAKYKQPKGTNSYDDESIFHHIAIRIATYSVVGGAIWRQLGGREAVEVKVWFRVVGLAKEGLLVEQLWSGRGGDLGRIIKGGKRG